MDAEMKTGLPKEECGAFCPKCGADLYMFENECFCKNKNCDFVCSKCKQNEIDEP